MNIATMNRQMWQLYTNHIHRELLCGIQAITLTIIG